MSFGQNQSRSSALNAADGAEQNAVVAQHAADVAGMALGTVIADVAKLQIHLAQVARLSHALAPGASSEPLAGR